VHKLVTFWHFLLFLVVFRCFLCSYLFFELWLYNAVENDFRYHGRFVSLRLNMTV
jgi:hypothetical protein